MNVGASRPMFLFTGMVRPVESNKGMEKRFFKDTPPHLSRLQDIVTSGDLPSIPGGSLPTVSPPLMRHTTAMGSDVSTDRRLLCMMPPELLGEVFAYSSFQNPDAPLVLGAVCSTFRHVVRSTPKAWTQLHIQATSSTSSLQDSGEEFPDARWARKAELWFSMAGVCPVDLHVQVNTSNAVLHPPTTTTSPPPAVGIKAFKTKPDDLWDNQTLPYLLHQYRYRIHGLALHTTTVNEADNFFTALYAPQSISELAAEAEAPLPLETLTFHASSDGALRSLALNIAQLRHKKHPATSVSLAQRHFPKLAHLKCVNHPLPEIISDGDALTPVNNAGSLRTLNIAYPLRFAPIALNRLLHVLGSAPLLENLEIEARVIDSVPNSSIPTNSGPSSESSTAYSPYPDLITLPRLTHLSLRINNLPALLSHLLLPALHTLCISDLDAKRAGAAAQTAAALRQVLVRMELPCAAAPAPREAPGLRVLDLSGVALEADAEGVWAWCVRRMRTLVELRARRVDTEALWSLITPPPAGVQGVDDLVLPRLRSLSIIEARAAAVMRGCGLSPSSSPETSPYAPQRSQATSGALLKFQLRRPEVQVDYRWVHDASQIPAGVDFLDYYH